MECSRLPASPAGEPNVGGATLGGRVRGPGWQEKTRFLQLGAKAGFATKIENYVAQGIVPDDSIPSGAAAAAVMAKAVQHIVAQQTKARHLALRHTQSVADFCSELGRRYDRTSGMMRNSLPYFSSPLFAL